MHITKCAINDQCFERLIGSAEDFAEVIRNLLTKQNTDLKKPVHYMITEYLEFKQ